MEKSKHLNIRKIPSKLNRESAKNNNLKRKKIMIETQNHKARGYNPVIVDTFQSGHSWWTDQCCHFWNHIISGTEKASCWFMET